MHRLAKLLEYEFTPSEGTNDYYSEGFNAGIRKAIELVEDQPDIVQCKDLINTLRKLHEDSPKEIEKIIDCLYWEFGLNKFDKSYSEGFEDGYREKEIETSEELDAMTLL